MRGTSPAHGAAAEEVGDEEIEDVVSISSSSSDDEKQEETILTTAKVKLALIFPQAIYQTMSRWCRRVIAPAAVLMKVEPCYKSFMM